MPTRVVVGGQRMNQENPRKNLELLLERQRQELSSRMDVSERTRQLSQSSSRHKFTFPQQRRRTTLTMLFTGVAVMFMILCVGSAVAIAAGGMWLGSQLSDPTTTVQRFYGSIRQQDYVSAYALLSTNAQKSLSQQAFSNQFASYDQVDGAIQAYPIAKSTVNGSQATVVVDVQRRGNVTMAVQQTLTLVQQNGDWKIVNITIGATVPVPSPTR